LLHGHGKAEAFFLRLGLFLSVFSSLLLLCGFRLRGFRQLFFFFLL